MREVVVGSPASNAGLRAGDVITAVDGKTVATVAELRQALEIKPGDEKRKLDLSIVRDHHEQHVRVELEKREPGVHWNEAAISGMNSADWKRVQAQAKAEMDAARRAMQQTQEKLSDQQRVISEKMKHAMEVYQKDVVRQKELQLQKVQRALERQNDVI